MIARFNIPTPMHFSFIASRTDFVASEADALVYDGAMDFNDGANEVEEYAYDANGNMTMDLNRGIESITYDWNNMPREITFTSGAITRYTYDAVGRKLRAEYITPLTASANYALRPPIPPTPPARPLPPPTITTVSYHGDCVLRDDSLERVLTPTGYIANDTLHYYIKDYQGNVRIVVRQDGAVVESNEYYPYGGLFAATTSMQPYKYSSKELDRTHGLDLYDSQARWYDSILGRTTTMDLLAEKYYGISPYAWCAGNPITHTDPTGKEVELYATSLPGCDLPLATHTFIVVRNAKYKEIPYYAFGSTIEGLRGAFIGRLSKQKYVQDMYIFENYKTEKIKQLKRVIKISPPEGMSSSEFDEKVISVAESFGNNEGISYNALPSRIDITQGNCNTSTSTILLKSGISPEQIKKIKEKIPGISYRFDTQMRPWTKEEQEDAVKKKQLADILYQIVGKP